MNNITRIDLSHTDYKDSKDCYAIATQENLLNH